MSKFRVFIQVIILSLVLVLGCIIGYGAAKVELQSKCSAIRSANTEISGNGEYQNYKYDASSIFKAIGWTADFVCDGK